MMSNHSPKRASRIADDGNGSMQEHDFLLCFLVLFVLRVGLLRQGRGAKWRHRCTDTVSGYENRRRQATSGGWGKREEGKDVKKLYGWKSFGRVEEEDRIWWSSLLVDSLTPRTRSQPSASF